MGEEQRRREERAAAERKRKAEEAERARRAERDKCMAQLRQKIQKANDDAGEEAETIRSKEDDLERLRGEAAALEQAIAAHTARATQLASEVDKYTVELAALE